ncbi:MAG: DUF2793 domain-containing protein [Alphaproteobacteria bacterium]|nr:DUF2793 domain-containing protein [Alphaproteobacteria bacterium]
MAITDHLGITLVEQSQSQKEVTVNTALAMLDAMLNTGVIDRDLTAPPVSPASGDLYIVASGATGAWAGKDNQIAWYSGAWKFIVPAEGLTFWVKDEDKLYSWNGTAWASTLEALTTPQFSRIGLGTTPHATHIINLFGPSALINGSAGFFLQMNKANAAQNLEFIFQQGFTTYAELGLLGDNEFTLKTSDGTNFYIAWKIRNSGVTNFMKEPLISEYSPINHKNYMINGNCVVAERQDFTLVNNTWAYGKTDRFQGQASGTAVTAGKLTQSAFSGKEYVKFETVTITGAGVLKLRYRIEAKDAEIFVNQTASFSCSLFQNIGSAMNCTVIVRKANAVDNFSATTVIATSSAVSVPNNSESPVKFENISMGDPSNGIEIELQMACGAITTKDFLIRQFQFEMGAFATQFEQEPVAVTRDKCKRFYQKLGKGLQGAFNSTTEIDLPVIFPVEMRTAPTGALLTTTPAIQHISVGAKTGASSAIVGASSSYSANGAYVRVNGYTGGTVKDHVYVTTDNILGFDADFA